jgi:glycosyltransferase involved in cell wall biosynthesis
MKVLLAHKFFKVTGGAEVFFKETGRLLSSRGHEVVYFSTSDSYNAPYLYSDYFVKPPDYFSGAIARRVISLPKMIWSKDAKAKFAQLLEVIKPDLVHVFAIHVHLTPSILEAAYDAGVPVVMSCNDYKHICPNYKLYHHNHICMDCKGGRFYKAIQNRCCKDSTAFSVASAIEAYVHDMMGVYRKYVHTYLFASNFMARETERFWGADSFRWKLLPNPFESQNYPYSPDYDEFGLYFGRLVDEKGVDVLVRAAAMAPEIHLKIIGNGPDENKLKTLAATLGLNNVEFVGPLWGKALDAVLSRTRYVVVPSLWHENFPYVINQSFAFGKPVIGAERGGITELVTHGERGLIYPATDSLALAQAMGALWSDPQWTVAMGRNAKVYSDVEFNDVRQYERLISIYQGVLSARTCSRR